MDARALKRLQELRADDWLQIYKGEIPIPADLESQLPVPDLLEMYDAGWVLPEGLLPPGVSVSDENVRLARDEAGLTPEVLKEVEDVVRMECLLTIPELADAVVEFAKDLGYLDAYLGACNNGRRAFARRRFALMLCTDQGLKNARIVAQKRIAFCHGSVCKMQNDLDGGRVTEGAPGRAHRERAIRQAEVVIQNAKAGAARLYRFLELIQHRSIVGIGYDDSLFED